MPEETRSKFVPKGVKNKTKLLSDYKPGRSRDRQERKRLKSKQKADRTYGVWIKNIIKLKT